MTGNQNRVVYIAGYSRCGSTILDMMLNRSPEIVSAGELTYLQDDAPNPKRVCSCGQRYPDCDRYGGWLAGRPEGEAALVRRIESRAGFEDLVAGKIAQVDMDAYHAYANSLFDHLHETGAASVVVDGSKSAKDAAGRPLALARLAGRDVRILHLSRDPRSTVRSYIDRGSNWVLEGHRAPKPLESWRPILGWTLANKFAQRLGREMGADRYMHVRLEDVRADPATALGRIGAFIGVDLDPVAEAVLAGEPFVAGHNVGGNRTRLKPQKIDLTQRPPDRLPAAHSLGLRLVGGQMTRQLGYA